MPNCQVHRFAAECETRVLFDQIADKWSMMVLTVLAERPHRFNAIKRELDGVSQKALTQCLRRLERNGLLDRKVVSFAPVAVEYAITPLGRTLLAPFEALYAWTIAKLPEVENARTAFDRRADEGLALVP
jgi:DNA-binding HxlR family transcriptional regulator